MCLPLQLQSLPSTRLGPPPPELLLLFSLPPQGAGSPQAGLAMTSVLHLEFCVKSGCYTSETVKAEQEALGREDGRRRVDSRVQTHQLRGAKPKGDNFLWRGESAKSMRVPNPGAVWLFQVPGDWFQPQLSPYSCDFGKSLSFLICKMGSC